MPERRLTTVGGYEISCMSFGEQPESLVLLHGLSGSGYWWRRNVDGLSREYRVILPDLVGFGASGSVRRVPEPAEMADALVRWMDGMELDRTHLAGHSMGGQISAHLAAGHPDRVERLALVDSTGIPRPLTTRNLMRFGMEMMPLWRWGDPNFLPVIAGDAITAGPRNLLRAIRHILEDDVRPLLERVRAPTLLIWGERDNLVPLAHAMEFRELIPDAELAVLRGAAHNPMVDRPADFNRLLLTFLHGARIGR